jgi:hypothetical protein
LTSWAPRFLTDSDFNEHIVVGLLRRWPTTDLVRLRDLGMARAPDPAIIAWTAENGRIVLSHDESTMPRFAVERLRNGLFIAGLVIAPQSLSIGRAIDDLELLARAADPSDLQSRILYLPL